VGAIGLSRADVEKQPLARRATAVFKTSESLCSLDFKTAAPTIPFVNGSMQMDLIRFQVIIEQDEDGLYVADVPALAGCHTQGKTFEEAVENIKEAIDMCVQELREDGQPIETRYPEVVGIKTLEIAV